jgi:two-component system NtrC family sensor kinase
MLDPSLQRLGTNGPLVKRYAKPVFGRGGVFLGAVVIDCDMQTVGNILSAVRVGQEGEVHLEDAQGKHLLDVTIGPFQRLLRGEAPILEGDGRWRWKVVVTVPAREFLEGPLKQIFYLTVLASMGACLFLLAIIVGCVSNLMHPIETLVDGTRRFASGDLTYRFPNDTSEELSLLGASFNKMAETLESRNRELENRLRQLTALRDMEESVIQRQDEETVLRTCLEAVARGFGFDRTSVYWVDHNNKEITGRYLYGSDGAGFSEAGFRKRRIPLGGDDILNDVVRKREAVVIKNPTVDPRAQPGFMGETKTREFVLAPICGKDSVLGILSADNSFTGRPLAEADREGLMLCANAAGLVLENALLFQNLAESESRLRTVLENSPEGVIGLSREHRISTWNRGAEKIFGLTAEEVLGQPLSVLFASTSGTEFNKLMNLVIEKGAVRDFVMPGKTKEGRPLSLSVSWGGAHMDFWMNKEWTLVVRDITEARRLQQQLIRSEKLSAVGQLISGIAHELNNPLQAVVGYSDILTDDLRQKLDPTSGRPSTVEASQVVDDLRVITENAMRCQKIIENLLLFVRQGEIEKKAIELPKILDATRELLQYKLKKAASVQVVVDFPKNLPRVQGNFQQLQQVFVNLINNACDAMGSQTGEKRITITGREEGDRVHVSVSDTGPGVPEMARSRLFEAFFTTKAEGRGTGLGLPVCRQIIEDHEGKISFSTEVGKGTTFLLELPVARSEAVLPTQAPVALPAVRNKHVLIVDDEPDVLGFLTKVVQSEGNRVDAATSIKDAISRAGKNSFDLVVTDIRLGEGNGLALYENWGLLSNQPRPLFAFMTGDVINTALAQDFEKRGLPLLHKPIDMVSFQTALRTLLAPKR